MLLDNESRFVASGAKGMMSLFAPFLEDNSISEIMVNKPQEVFVERNGKMDKSHMPSLTPLYLKRLFNFIANESGQVLNEEHPLLSANLFDGSRVQLVIPPVSEHYTLCIRRKSIKDMGLQDYKSLNFFDEAKPFFTHSQSTSTTSDEKLNKLYCEQDWFEFLKEAVLAKKNIVISGGTSSGKTTLLNALLKEIPEDERLITLEDTKEITVGHQNLVSLVASKGKQSKANITMQDLVQSCLRLRPDRIIMGEIRGAEIMDFISSCSTGHEGSITSIHANNPKVAFMRMVQMYKLNNVPSMRDEDILKEISETMDIIAQVAKTRAGRKLTYCYYKDAK